MPARAHRLLVVPALLAGLAACAPRAAKPDAPAPAPAPATASRTTSKPPAKPPAKPAPKGYLGEGIASFYGPGLHGRPTANGERFNQNAMTAAHRKLSFGTCVRVVNLTNGRQVRVRVNDRGPYVEGRIIDVSRAAAVKLDMLEKGVARVRLYRCDEVSEANASRGSTAAG
jgi:rare lipoprotein A